VRPLEELRLVERAVVLKGGVRAATLVRRHDAVVFAYDAEYLAGRGPPVATTLPLSETPVLTHAAGALPPYFSGLLPEGRRLQALRADLKTSADDDFSMLLAVGGDTVGDVTVIPAGDVTVTPSGEVTAIPAGDDAPLTIEPAVIVGAWDEIGFRDLLATPGKSQRGWDRVALPGVQDKLSAGLINLPVARRGERYLLKLDPPGIPHLVANEAFFLQAARRSQLETARAEVVHDREGVPGLLVRRFDRIAHPDGRVQSIPQEDGCQVLGRYPADKYRVTTEEVIGALSAVCPARPVAALTLLRQVAFAYLSCNGDAHAKNFSVFAPSDGEWRVTPAYDLPSTYPYRDFTLALSLNGRTREDIGRADFLALGEAVGLRPRAVEGALDRLVGAVDRWVEELHRLPFDAGLIHKLRRAIEYRRDRLGRH
jgi:serine/threonine-protein kinase HipA